MKSGFCFALAMVTAPLFGCRQSIRVNRPMQVDAPSPARTNAPPPSRDLGDGLLVTDITPGHGPPCSAQSVVEVRFVAMLSDRTVWDSSEERKRSIEFSLSDPGLIEGLRRGIPGMRVGGTRRIEIPWMLGYGAAGRDPVPPRADLLFEIELIGMRDANTKGK